MFLPRLSERRAGVVTEDSPMRRGLKYPWPGAWPPPTTEVTEDSPMRRGLKFFIVSLLFRLVEGHRRFPDEEGTEMEQIAQRDYR